MGFICIILCDPTLVLFLHGRSQIIFSTIICLCFLLLNLLRLTIRCEINSSHISSSDNSNVRYLSSTINCIL
jgi:hypothetical protein